MNCLYRFPGFLIQQTYNQKVQAIKIRCVLFCSQATLHGLFKVYIFVDSKNLRNSGVSGGFNHNTCYENFLTIIHN